MSSTVNSIGDVSLLTSRSNRSRNTSAQSTSAAQDMINKLDALFRIKTKTLFMDSFDRLTPLKNLAKSAELRQSLLEVMPETAAASAGSRLDHSEGFDTSGNDDPSEFIDDDDDEGSEFSVELGLPTTLDSVMDVDANTDKRAAKSIIRLSNAILPLLSFYNASLEADQVPELKPSSTPTKNGKNKFALRKNKTPTNKLKPGHVDTTPNTNLSSLTGAAPPRIDIQEVHHAFHAVLRQVHRLESSASTALLAYSAGAQGVQGVQEEVPPPPPALVDVLMQENNSKVYAHITSLEKQLHLVQDSKKRQYESLLAQLHTSEALNASLKKKLDQATREKDEFVQVAVDKEKQLQAAYLHLGAAQDEIKSLKVQVARIPRAQRESLKQTTKASLHNSRYSASQFIKLTAQIDLLREELKRERQASHDRAVELTEAAHLAESKLAHSENIVLQLQTQIANSDYFVLDTGGVNSGGSGGVSGIGGGRYLQHEEHHPSGSPANSLEDESPDQDQDQDLDDSHLYLDAHSQHSQPSQLSQLRSSAEGVARSVKGSGSGGAGAGAGGSVRSSGIGNVVTGAAAGHLMSSISSVGSKHSERSEEVHGSGAGGAGSLSRSITPVPKVQDGSGGSDNNANVTTPPRRHHTTHTTHAVRTPPSMHTTHTNTSGTHPASPQRARVRESVTVSPTRSSYERTLATVEQFAPTAAIHMHSAHANTTHLTNTAHHANTSANTGANANTVPKQPWRPSTPNPSPTLIRSGYYHYVHNVDTNNTSTNTTANNTSSRAGSPYKTLHESGFVFNPHHTHRTHHTHSAHNTTRSSRGSGASPVRSLRGKFSAQGASWLNTPNKRNTVHNTTTSSVNRRSQSASPYRRYSIGSSTNHTTQHLHPHYADHLHAHYYTQPPHVPGAHINKDLDLGRCTYCTHNLLELWTNKFDKFGPRSSRSRSLLESTDAVEQGSSPEDGNDYLGDGSGSTSESGDEGPGSLHSQSKRSVHSEHSKHSEHTSNTNKESVRSVHSKHTTHTTPTHTTTKTHHTSNTHLTHITPNTTLVPTISTTPPATQRKSHTAVKDSAGNSISYALNRSGSERDLTKPSLHNNKSESGISTIGVSVTGSVLSAKVDGGVHESVGDRPTSPHSPHSVHFNVSRSRSADHTHTTAHTLNTLHSHGSRRGVHNLRSSWDYLDDMSAITEESRGVEQEHYAHSVLTNHNTSSVHGSSVQGTVHGSNRMGIADTGMSPPTTTSRGVSSVHGRDVSPPRLPHLRSAESPVHGGGSKHATPTKHTSEPANTTNTTNTTTFNSNTVHTTNTVNTTPHSSSDTLNTAQHAQLLVHLSDRDLHLKPYTTTDARHLTPTEVTTQYNTLIKAYNDVLYTLGNEVLAIEGVKSDYKAEITESVNQVATLQKLVHSLQQENDTLISTINTYEAEKSDLLTKHDALLYNIQDELLQCRNDCEDLLEEKNSLMLQLRDAVSTYGGVSGSSGGINVAVGYSGSGSTSRRTSFDHTVHTGTTAGSTHATHSTATLDPIVQQNTLYNSSSRSPSRSASRDADYSRGVINTNGSVHSVRDVHDVRDVSVQYSRSRSDSEEPSSLIEQQALRVAAEARAEHIKHEHTLLSAELAALHATLHSTQTQCAEITEENSRLKSELFDVEVSLADTRERLTLSESTAHTLDKECSKLRTALHTTKEECSDKIDAQYAEHTKLMTQVQQSVQEMSIKLNSATEVSAMQQQLLTQKDLQIQQVKDAQYTQQGLYNALQLQLQNASSKENSANTNSATQMSEQEITSLKQRLLEAETIASIQTTLLQQRDHQLALLKEEHRSAQEACSSLKQQLAQSERGGGGGGSSVGGGMYGLSVANPANVASSSGSVGNVYQAPGHPAAAALSHINTTHSVQNNSNSTHNTPHALATYSNDGLAQIESLKQQLDATFRELELAKRGSGVAGVGSSSGNVSNNLHYNSSASSHNTPLARSVYNSASYSVQGMPPPSPHTPHTPHTTHTNTHHTPASPLSVHSTYSTVTGTSTNTNTHNNHYNYVGDLQYISNLAAIQEESTVRSGTSTGANNTVDQNTVNTTNSSHGNTHNTSTAHNNVHSVYGNSVYSSAFNNVLPGIAEQSVNSSTSNANGSGNNVDSGRSGVGSVQGGSVQGTISVQGTPLHTMLGGMYHMQQQQQADQQAHVQAQLQHQLNAATTQLQQQQEQESNTQAHISSLTATNLALTSRCTQLEERLRHSELRCKLLMDQIKSMPVSLSVAQAEKRVIEAKLEKATATYTANLKKVSDGTAKKIHELSAYLQLERSERAKLETTLSENKATIHQLSHHIQILRSQAQVSVYSDVMGSGGSGGSGGVSGGGVEYTSTYSRATHTGGVLNETHHMANTHMSNGMQGMNMNDTHSHMHNVYSSGSHNISHNNSHNNSSSVHNNSVHNGQAQFSRTVPLTPMSVKAPLHHTYTPTHFTAYSNPGSNGTSGASGTGGANSGAGGTGGSLPYATNNLAQQVQNSNNSVNIIRASIPPAPWEDA